METFNDITSKSTTAKYEEKCEFKTSRKLSKFKKNMV